MLFNSFEFLFFLPVVFLLYWFVFRRLKAQNAFVVVSSYVFYGWWDWRFLILIAITTICSFISGILIERYNESRKVKLAILWTNVLLNLGILGIFKYYNFFAQSFVELFAPLGIQFDDVTLDLILPVGISFYTFQALSYSIDVYRKSIPATHNVVAFFAFISFFPQLVAGPIERATNLLPQFLKPRKFDYPTAVDGCRQILWGLFKKSVVADCCAEAVNPLFSSYLEWGGVNLLLGAILFSFQIYCDFSGYSDIAIGTAKLFGIKLIRNFNVPYFSRDIAEFWRRWHISLNKWFIDYIYIPLGGSRCKKSKVIRNTFVIFLVSGIWHGANWTYIAWGAYHAVLFMPLIAAKKNRKYLDNVASGRMLPSFRESLMMGWTFILVMIGWIIFRAETITHAWGYIRRIFTDFTLTKPVEGLSALMWVMLMLIWEWVERNQAHGMQFKEHGLLKYKFSRWCFYYGILLICYYFAPTNIHTFIYFQF